MPKHDFTPDETRRGAQAGGLARAEKVRAEKDEARRLLLEARRERLDAAIERLAAAAERAAAVIEELLGATSETVRLRSAVALLEILDIAETRELAERLERARGSLRLEWAAAVNRTKASIERGIERLEETAGLRTCPTCAGWADVIEMDWPGRRREGLPAEWHVWREHGGRCPACGQEPTVQTVRFGWPLDPERLHEYNRSRPGSGR